MRSALTLLLLGALLSPTAAFAQAEGDPPADAPAEAGAPAETSPEAAPEASSPDAEREAIEALDEPSDGAAPVELEEIGEPGSDLVVPDPEAEALSDEEAARLQALQDEADAPQVEEPQPVDDSAATGWSYYDGKAAGEADARIAAGYMQHGLAGLAGGLICSGCGCVGVTAAELLVAPGVPQGPWQANDSSYQRGYIDGYRKTVQRRRAFYAAAGGTLGAAVAFGTGFAMGVYGVTPPFLRF
ncbi:MAG: hypothetical protein H6741_19430 [Alphaproteobacteria bacterium]|nr:hypothetical protein [Alphaproteobacteria bacterium]